MEKALKNYVHIYKYRQVDIRSEAKTLKSTSPEQK